MKVGIITIYDNNNYGNRLQNYATQEILKNIGVKNVETIQNTPNLNNRRNIVSYSLRKVKNFLKKLKNKSNDDRYYKFMKFNKYIKLSSQVFDYTKIKKFNYDYCIIGSDQVWNPYYRLSEFDLGMIPINKKRVAFSASFAVEELPEFVNKIKLKNQFLKIDSIATREEAGKRIVENLTERKDIEVIVDPTMLLSVDDWNKVINKPEQLISSKYILNYFLGTLSEERKNEINRIAKENDCEVINILDKNEPFYQTGPSEFLYLEKNAFLICTDSFHSSVFALLYNRPFIVFNREDKNVSMNSRIETLINKFNLKNRKFEGTITKENLEHDYTEAYEILEKEREKANNFLKKTLDLY